MNNLGFCQIQKQPRKEAPFRELLAEYSLAKSRAEGANKNWGNWIRKFMGENPTRLLNQLGFNQQKSANVLISKNRLISKLVYSRPGAGNLPAILYDIFFE